MSAPLAEAREATRIQKRRASDAVMLSLLIALSLSVLSIAGSIVFARAGNVPRAFVPALSAVVTLAGAGLIYRGRLIAGATLSLIALGATLLFLISQFTGLGIAGALVFTLVAVTLVAHSFPEPLNVYSLIVTVAVGALLLLLELYWPWKDRASLPEGTFPIVIAALSIGLLVVAYSLRSFRDYSLRRKVLTAFLFLSFVPLIVIVIVSDRSAKRQHTEEADTRLVTTAEQTVLAVDEFIQENLLNIDAEAGTLAVSGYFRLTPEFRAGSRPEETVITLLESNFIRGGESVISYAIFDLRGEILLEYPPDLEQVDEVNRDYLTGPVETGEPYVSPVEFTPVNGGPFIIFSAPIFDENDQMVGVLRARHESGILQQVIERSSEIGGAGTNAILIDENLMVLADGANPNNVYGLLAPIDPEKLGQLQESLRLPVETTAAFPLDLSDFAADLGDSQFDLAGGASVIDISGLPDESKTTRVAVDNTEAVPWQLLVFLPDESFQAPVEDQSRMLVLTAVVLAAVVSILALVFSDFLTAPIGRLQEAAARVSHGDLNVRVRVESDDEIGWLARTFNAMTARLQYTLLGLEHHVASRSHALVAITKVGRRLSTALDEGTLVSEVVDLLQESSDYYSVQIYMIKDKSMDLFLVSGTGEAGQLLLEQGHKIRRGQGLVGRAADRNSIVLVPHCEDDPFWISNPHLPDTKSEVAVPISLGEDVLGVLDVQDDGAGGLGQQDADLLLSIANQVAIAIQNARSYAQLRRQAEHRANINEISRAIQGTTNAESAMQVMIRELGRAVGASSTSIWLDVAVENQDGKATAPEAPPPATSSGKFERLI